MEGTRPKQYMEIAGQPMLQYALETFASVAAVAHTYVVVSPEDAYIEELLERAAHLVPRISVLRVGGRSRHESVRSGLQAVREQIGDHDWVLVHDAARPGLSPALVERLIEALQHDSVGGLLALPVVDTLKSSNGDERAHATVSRENLWAAQTPQMFRYALLCRALELAPQVTDEAGAVEALGLQPRLVEGSARNFKVTLPNDLSLAELYLKEKQ
jgi:2-C-methyl-D-erythritol 4-phosphate cytidylyltransferase